MIVIKGNLLHSPIQIWAHQVNCKGVMNAGVARQIRQTYPEVYDTYVEYTKDYIACNNEPPLGECFTYLSDDESHYILNIYGQNQYGTSTRQTDYEALKKGLLSGIRQLRYDYCAGDYPSELQLTIAIPYKIGCGLAGGDWEVVKGILEEIEFAANVLFVAYEL